MVAWTLRDAMARTAVDREMATSDIVARSQHVAGSVGPESEWGSPGSSGPATAAKCRRPAGTCQILYTGIRRRQARAGRPVFSVEWKLAAELEIPDGGSANWGGQKFAGLPV